MQSMVLLWKLLPLKKKFDLSFGLCQSVLIHETFSQFCKNSFLTFSSPCHLTYFLRSIPYQIFLGIKLQNNPYSKIKWTSLILHMRDHLIVYLMILSLLLTFLIFDLLVNNRWRHMGLVLVSSYFHSNQYQICTKRTFQLVISIYRLRFSSF